MFSKLSAAAVILGTVASANAAVFVSPTVTTNAVAGWDKIVFSISSVTGTDVGKTLTGLKGTFSAGVGTLSVFGSSSGNNISTSLPNASYPADADGTYWGDRTAKIDASSVAATGPRSFINFATVTPTIGTVAQPSDFVRLSDTSTPTSFSGSWFTSSTAQYLTTGSTLATIYVSTGGNVSFAGTESRSDGQTPSLTFTSVPEPTAMAGLGLGLTAMLARRRRVQK